MLRCQDEHGDEGTRSNEGRMSKHYPACDHGASGQAESVGRVSVLAVVVVADRLSVGTNLFAIADGRPQ